MEKLTLIIPIPKIIASLVLWFVLHHRKKHYGYTFRRIKLAKDKFAIVDVEDYLKLSEYDWHLCENKSKNSYAFRQENGRFIKMHRVIMNAPAGVVVDHKYGDGLDNRKVNLRIATIAQNQYNRRKISRKTTSKYKGVHYRKKSKKYYAAIGHKGKKTHLGCFGNEIDAAKAYDEAAKMLFGDFASLNFE